MGWLTALKLDVAYVELLMDHPREKQYAVVMNEAAVSQMRMKSERNNKELTWSDNHTDNHLSCSTPFSSPWTTAMRMKSSSLPSPGVSQMRMKEREKNFTLLDARPDNHSPIPSSSHLQLGPLVRKRS